MRFMSKGIGLSLFLGSAMKNFITFALTLSRCARDLNTINEKNTVSPDLSLTIGGKVAIFIPPEFGLRSSPTHSKYPRAPYFFQIFPAALAILRYTDSFFLGTGKTNPSTYFMIPPSNH